jgi:hypothetical protein
MSSILLLRGAREQVAGLEIVRVQGGLALLTHTSDGAGRAQNHRRTGYQQIRSIFFFFFFLRCVVLRGSQERSAFLRGS